AQIEAFGLEHFRIVERPLVPLRHHEIRIQVHAASLNYRDLLIALGQGPSNVSNLPLPLVPLSDCSGEVIEVGGAVDRFQIGDRVASAHIPHWMAGPFKPENGHSALGGSVDGVLARYFKGNQRGFVKIPDALS